MTSAIKKDTEPEEASKSALAQLSATSFVKCRPWGIGSWIKLLEIDAPGAMCPVWTREVEDGFVRPGEEPEERITKSDVM